VVIYIFIAQICVLAGLVSMTRVSELSEHHQWLFINYFDEEKWRSHFTLTNKFN
jgi:hypothetical protein